MRILVTGYSGFVGSRFVASCNEGDEIVCIGRSEISESPTRSFVKTDIGDSQSVAAAAQEIEGDFDALVHLAAHVPKHSSEDLLISANNVNVNGLVNILESFSGRFRSVVLGSTAEVYDQSRISGVISEDTPVNAGSYYGATKLASEFISRTYGIKNNVPAIVLRFSVMYGPFDPIARALPNFIKAALADQEIAVYGGNALRDYVYIDDVVDSIHCALRSRSSGTVNIGTGVGVSIVAAAQSIIDLSNSKSQLHISSTHGGVDIVLSPQRAQELIGFTAQYTFPDKLKTMIDSYR